MNYYCLLATRLSFACLLLFGACRPIEINYFKASPQTVSIGDSVRFVWELSKIRRSESLYILDQSSAQKYYPDKIKLKDTFSILPKSSGSYTLTVEMRAKSRKKEADKPEKITRSTYVNLTYDVLMGTDSLVAGEVGQLEWIINRNSTNRRIVALQEGKVVKEWRNVKSNGLLDVNPFRNTTYRIYYKMGDNMQSLDHFIKVKNAMFTGSQEVIFGDQAQLIWRLHPKFEEAEIYELDAKQNIRKTHKVGNKGVLAVNPKRSSSYILAYGDEPKTKVLHRIEILQGKLNGNKFIPKGETAVLIWQINPQAEDAWIEGQDGGGSLVKLQTQLQPEGKIEVEPLLKNNRYDLCVKFAGEVWRYSHFIKVQTPPRPFIKQVKNLAELPADQKIDMEIFEYDRSNYPQEIRFKVLVTDNKGSFISGLADNDSLAKQYFRRIVDRVAGRSQEIDNFQVKEINQNLSKPYSLAMSLDYSGSMWGNIPALELAVKKMIEQKASEDEVTITKFDDNLVNKISNERDTLQIMKQMRKEDNLGGCTALFAGANESMRNIKTDKKRKTMLLFTDGWDNSSMMYEGTHATRAIDLVKKARALGFKIYPVSFGRGVNAKVMSAIGVLTDAKPYFLKDESEIAGLYEEFPRLMHNYYEVVYKPVASEGAHVTELTFFDGEKEKTTLGQTHIGENYSDPETYEDVNFDPSESSYSYNSTPSLTTASPNTNSNANINPPSTSPSNTPPIVTNQPQTPPSEPIPNVEQVPTPKPKYTPQVVALFDFESHEIEEKYLPKLERIVDYLKRNSEVIIEVRGHSDLQGTLEGCKEISRKRAEIITNYLKEQGIAEERLMLRALGRSEPVWFKENEDWQKRENRRVEILILE